ncbi:MAG: 3-deoxy-D-manno-octulosonic acid transferase [Bradymonadia bacterium]
MQHFEPLAKTHQFWFHGASVGDLLSLKPIIHTCEREGISPSCISYWSTEARTMASQLYPHRPVRRAPLPVKPFVDRFVTKYGIEACVLEYLELYPGWVHSMNALGKPIGVVNGRVTDKSLRVAWLLKGAAERLSFFWAQSQRDAEMAEALGVSHEVIEVLGSTKYDRILHQTPPCSAALRKLLGDFDVVIGSIHPDEERGLCAALSRYSGRALIAPRYLNQVERLHRNLERLDATVSRRSQPSTGQSRFVILDTVGELHAAYSLAEVAIVGGTFGKRNGQNLFEPISMGSSVLYGSRHSRIFDQIDVLADFGVKSCLSFGEALERVSRRDFVRFSLDTLKTRFPPTLPRVVKRLKRIAGSPY